MGLISKEQMVFKFYTNTHRVNETCLCSIRFIIFYLCTILGMVKAYFHYVYEQIYGFVGTYNQFTFVLQI